MKTETVDGSVVAALLKLHPDDIPPSPDAEEWRQDEKGFRSELLFHRFNPSDSEGRIHAGLRLSLH